MRSEQLELAIELAPCLFGTRVVPYLSLVSLGARELLIRQMLTLCSVQLSDLAPIRRREGTAGTKRMSHCLLLPCLFLASRMMKRVRDETLFWVIRV